MPPSNLPTGISTPPQETPKQEQPSLLSQAPEPKIIERGHHWIVPVAIIIAGALVGFGIFLSVIKSPQTNNTASAPITIKPVDSTDHILGNPDASVVIVEFSDTECPFCKEFYFTMQQIMNTYGTTSNQVAWVYRQMPIDSLHTRARHEAEATECVASIGGNDKFWQYLTQIYTLTQSNDSLDPAELPKIATDIGIDQNAFNTCLASNQFDNKINADIADGTNAGAKGTPYSVLITKSGQTVGLPGAYTYNLMKSIIDSYLKPTQ